MLYPIIRRVRRPLLPVETATPPATEEVPIVEQSVVTPAIAEPVASGTIPVASTPQPEVKVEPTEPKPPVTSTKPKRAKAAEEKSRKTTEPRE